LAHVAGCGAFFDPMTPPSVAYVGGGGSERLMTSLLSSVAYELESDIRTEIFSSVRTKVISRKYPIFRHYSILQYILQFHSVHLADIINKYRLGDSRSTAALGLLCLYCRCTVTSTGQNMAHTEYNYRAPS